MLKCFKNKELGNITSGYKNRTKNYGFSEWKSKGFAYDVVKPFTKSDTNGKKPLGILNYDGFKSFVVFKNSCLEKEADIYYYGKIINIYIVYELSPNLNNYEFTLENCLFG